MPHGRLLLGGAAGINTDLAFRARCKQHSGGLGDETLKPPDIRVQCCSVRSQFLGWRDLTRNDFGQIT